MQNAIRLLKMQIITRPRDRLRDDEYTQSARLQIVGYCNASFLTPLRHWDSSKLHLQDLALLMFRTQVEMHIQSSNSTSRSIAH